MARLDAQYPEAALHLRSDRCLLHAKRTGRNKTVCEDEIHGMQDVA